MKTTTTSGEGRRAMRLAALVILMGAAAAPDCSGQAGGRRELPGFFQFYLKTGGMKLLRSEAQRDRLIESGALKPETIGRPAPDLALPRPDGSSFRVRGLVGRKNLLVVTFRTWW